MRLRPEGVEFPLEKGTASFSVKSAKADSHEESAITPGESSATVTLDLPAGPAQLHTTIDEEKRGSRGAYFVIVKRVEEK